MWAFLLVSRCGHERWAVQDLSWVEYLYP